MPKPLFLPIGTRRFGLKTPHLTGYHKIMIEDLLNVTLRRADLNLGSPCCVPSQATATYTNEEHMFRTAFLKIR
jgi:hypothetical protein